MRVPVGVGRRPDEPSDPALRRWYEALLRVRAATDRDRARFVLHPPDAGRPGPTPTVAWSWEAADGATTSVAVNLGTMSSEVAVPASSAAAPTDALDGRRLWPLPAPTGVQRFLLAPGEVLVLQP